MHTELAGGRRPDGPVIAGVRVFETADAAAAVRRKLAPMALATPYQSAAWVGAWLRAVSPRIGETPFLVGLFDAEGEPLALLPLATRRLGPLKLAVPIGGTHANFHFGLFRHDSLRGLPPSQLSAALDLAARRVGVDAYLLHQQARRWSGGANPLALLGGIPCVERGRRTALQPDGKAWLAANLSGSRRRMIRKKERWLSESGEWRFVEARSEADVDRMIDAYQAQKAQWFCRRGIRNVFADPGIDAFLRDAAKTGLVGGHPGIAIHGLEVAGEFAAVIGAATDRDRFCLMFTSADIDRFGRSSPGELLLIHLIEESCARGMTTLDLGVGEDAYKEHYCSEDEPLFDLAIPVTWRGRVAARAWIAQRRALAWAKHNARVRAAVARLRSLRAGTREGPAGELMIG